MNYTRLIERTNGKTAKGATNTLAATSEGVGTALDDFADKHHLDKQDIIELVLYDFFEKYGENYTGLRKGDDT